MNWDYENRVIERTDNELFEFLKDNDEKVDKEVHKILKKIRQEIEYRLSFYN